MNTHQPRFSFFGFTFSLRQRLVTAGLLMVLLSGFLMQSCLNSQVEAAEPTTQPQMAAIDRTWQRTDEPVKNGQVARTWIWGPARNTSGLEDYQQSPGGKREVVYWDKSRMEINQPAGDPLSKWYVTNGLLVKEMISGQIQIGDAQFMPYHPANEAVAGDPISVNQEAPTYASLQNVASLNLDKRLTNRQGQNIIERLDKAGNVTLDPSLASYGVTYRSYENTLGHNMPNVLTDFFARQGPVMENGQMVNGTVFEWLYAAGLPLTEPYWMQVKVAGVQKDVLVQAFERRVVTYTPSNAAGWQVEMGNVGMHYYTWRYGSDSNNAPIARVPGGNNETNGKGNGGNGGSGNGGSGSGNGGGGGNPSTPTPVATTPGGGGGGGNGTPTPAPTTPVGTPTPAPTTPAVTPTPTPTTPATPQTGCISISAGAGVTLNIGGSVSVPITIKTSSCFGGTINLGVSGAAGGIQASLSANAVVLSPNSSANVTLNLSAGTGLAPGGVSLKVSASTNFESVNTSVGVSLVIPGDFSISSGGNITLKLNSTGSTSINLQALGGFSGPVSLSVSGVALGVNASLTPNVTLGVNGASSANLKISSSSLVGVAVLTIKGSSNGKVHSVTVNVSVVLG